MPAALEDKVAFFERYRTLVEESSDEEDSPEDGKKNNRAAVSEGDVSALTPHLSRALPRTVSLPTPSLPKSLSAPVRVQQLSQPQVPFSGRSPVVIEETPLLPRRQETWPLSRSALSSPAIIHETPMPEPARRARERGLIQVLNTPTNPILGKRKRKEQSIKLVPEAQRIFTNLNFFYVPNNDISAARRAKIVKAREYGAQWVTDWDESVTHIIVDQSLRHQDVLLSIRPAELPPNVIIVNEVYPIECIQFKALLNPVQTQYLVEGGPTAASVSSQTSDLSLHVKPSRSTWAKWDIEPTKETPEKSQASTQPYGQNRALNSPALSSQSSLGFDKKETNSNGGGASEDALDQTIRELQSIKHLPLEDDEEEGLAEEGDEESSSDEAKSPSQRPTTRASTRTGKEVDTSTFACVRGGRLNSSTANDRTISILEEMADYYSRVNDQWRTFGYRRAISTLRRQSKKIETAEQALALPFIGQRIANKIEEIVMTDRLQHLDSAKQSVDDQILQEFMKVYGAGPLQAAAWVRQGFRSLRDLEEKASMSATQRIGIEHFEDFQTRIPRAEVATLGEIVRSAARELDPRVEVIIGGSYRRGAPESGDIDCLLTRPGTSSVEEFSLLFSKLLVRLRETEFLVASLSTTRSSMWHGCCALPRQPGDDSRPIWRRIDLLVVPDSELGAALLYFTGNDIFNRSMRLLASRKGMSLNQRGLYKDVLRLRGRVKATRGSLVESKDERKIFEALGVPWRAPEERVC